MEHLTGEKVWPARYISEQDLAARVPVYVVWELTLACDLKCAHCGSRAGRRRRTELSTDQALSVVDHLAKLGTREITLIGGEAYLRRDWLTLVEAITGKGIVCGLQSGGFGLTAERLQAAVAAGLSVVGISIDGLEEVHDRLRGVRGSFLNAARALREARDAGIATHANTQINALTLPELDRVADLLIELGVSNWLVQLTVPMGRAADNHEILLQPWQLLEVMPKLSRLYDRGLKRGLLLQIGNNVGYFGPYEAKLRGSGNSTNHWMGCQAGKIQLALESDGTLKGCPSLPTRSYADGNVRDVPLDELWRRTMEAQSSAERSQAELWGFCAGCRYRHHCSGGCTWTSHSIAGRPGNNPFCHHRALSLHKKGLRETIVRREPAPGAPFDHGRFDFVLETIEGAPAVGEEWEFTEQPIDRDATLKLCPGCLCHIDSADRQCPLCGIDTTSGGPTVEKRQRLVEIVGEIEALLAPSQ